MITENEKNIIIHNAQKYDVASLYLFGSSVEAKVYNDIDLAVKGIAPQLFFEFYGELIKHLDIPVDLVDLSQESLFNNLIEKTGIKIYG